MATKTKKRVVKKLSFEERRQSIKKQIVDINEDREDVVDKLRDKLSAIDEEERLHNLKIFYDNVDSLLKIVKHSEDDGNDARCLRENQGCSEYCPRCALLLLKKNGVKNFKGGLTLTLEYDN